MLTAESVIRMYNGPKSMTETVNPNTEDGQKRIYNFHKTSSSLESTATYFTLPVNKVKQIVHDVRKSNKLRTLSALPKAEKEKRNAKIISAYIKMREKNGKMNYHHVGDMFGLSPSAVREVVGKWRHRTGRV